MENMIPTLAYIVLIVAIMYFFIMRPEKKRKKQQEDMRNSLKIGDVITTIGGIIGTIVELTDDAIVIETSEDRVRMQIARWAIGNIGKATTEAK